MEDIKLGYDSPKLYEEELSDHSKTYGIIVYGDYTIRIHCTDLQAAKNLISVWDHSVVDIDIGR